MKIKNNKKGFTLVEILTVLFIIGLITALAVPAIFSSAKKMQSRALNNKIDAIEKAATLYGEEHANSIKSSIGTCSTSNSSCACTTTSKTVLSCKNPNTGATCNKTDPGCNCQNVTENVTTCDYLYTTTVKGLIELGGYEAESDAGSNCLIADPTDKEKCLDNAIIKITIDDKYKTASAELEY